jgi:hypothetical protein
MSGATPFNAKNGLTVGVPAISVLDTSGNYVVPQAKNTALAGPSSGANAPPTFRTLSVAAGDVTLVSADVVTALGYTPYSNANPSGYQTASQVNSAISAAITGSTGQIFRGTVPQQSANTQIPFGNAAPTSTQGTQLWSCTITPASATSNIVLRFSGVVNASNANDVITIAYFRGTTLLGFTSGATTSGSGPTPFCLEIADPSPGTSSVTYSCRIGVNNAHTWYIGRGAGATMGGVNNASWSVREEF